MSPTKAVTNEAQSWGGGQRWKASSQTWAFVRGSAPEWGSAALRCRQSLPYRPASWVGRSRPASPGWSGLEGFARNLLERPEQTPGGGGGSGGRPGEEALPGTLVPASLPTGAFVGHGSKFCDQTLMPTLAGRVSGLEIASDMSVTSPSTLARRLGVHSSRRARPSGSGTWSENAGFSASLSSPRPLI